MFCFIFMAQNAVIFFNEKTLMLSSSHSPYFRYRFLHIYRKVYFAIIGGQVSVGLPYLC